jgi:hypothetical protein
LPSDESSLHLHLLPASFCPLPLTSPFSPMDCNVVGIPGHSETLAPFHLDSDVALQVARLLLPRELQNLRLNLQLPHNLVPS